MTNRFAVGGVLALLAAGSLFAQQPQGKQAQQAKGQPQQAQQAQQAPVRKGPAAKSPEEAAAIQAVFQAPDADTRIKGIDEFVAKYPDSEFKGLILLVQSQSYQQKGDYERMIVSGEQSLEANPEPAVKIQAMLMLASSIAQKTREFDLDKQEKLDKVDKYTKGALDLIGTMEKPNPNLTDEQWAGAKADMTATAYEAQGMAALAKKDYEGAAKQFKLASETAKTPEPATSVRLAAAYNLGGKPDDAIEVLDKVLADPALNVQVKQIAQAERARAVQAKNKAAAKPAEEKK